MIRLFEIGFLAIIIVVCAIHTHRFALNKPVGPLFHAIWAAVYFAPCVFIGLLEGSYGLIGASLLVRFVFYNPILNFMRHRHFFYLSINSKNPSWWDHLEMAWEDVYPWVWIISILGLITINFFI